MGEVCFFISTSLTKISILLFYRRLVDRAYGRVMQWAIYAAIAFSIAYLAGFLLFLVFVCSPTSAVWNSLDITYSQPYKCVSRRVADPLAGALSVFSDVYSLAIPEVVVSSMRLPWRQKIALYGIFSTGLLYVTTSLVSPFHLLTSIALLALVSHEQSGLLVFRQTVYVTLPG